MSTIGNGEVGRGVVSGVILGIAGRLAWSSSDKGDISVFSLMLMTIFSSPRAVMCFSFPLLRLNAESSMSSGVRFGLLENGLPLAVCVWSVSSDATESPLRDNSGTSFGLGAGRVMSIAGVVARCGCASQQNVSLFHSRQLRFSNLLPSWIDSAHFEKTSNC